MPEAVTAWLAETAFTQAVATTTGFTAAQVASAMVYTTMVVSPMDGRSKRARQAARTLSPAGAAAERNTCRS